MAEITVQLEHGLKIGEAVHREAVLREPTVGDIVEAGCQAERVVEAGGEVHLVKSPTLAGLLLLGRQIVRIGEHGGPLGQAELLKLHVDDFQALQAAADKLDLAAAKRAQERAAGRGRADPAR